MTDRCVIKGFCCFIVFVVVFFLLFFCFLFVFYLKIGPLWSPYYMQDGIIVAFSVCVSCGGQYLLY